jgi:hypothetical protein
LKPSILYVQTRTVTICCEARGSVRTKSRRAGISFFIVDLREWVERLSASEKNTFRNLLFPPPCGSPRVWTNRKLLHRCGGITHPPAILEERFGNYQRKFIFDLIVLSARLPLVVLMLHLASSRQERAGAISASRSEHHGGSFIGHPESSYTASSARWPPWFQSPNRTNCFEHLSLRFEVDSRRNLPRLLQRP